MKKPMHQVELERDMTRYRVVPRKEREALLTDLQSTFESFVAQGHGVFAVTLSTFVKSRSFAEAHFSRFWREEFIRRIIKRVPHRYRTSVNHEFYVEMTKEGHFHFHGMLAVNGNAKHKLWRDGCITPALRADLDSLAHEGKYEWGNRTFAVNSYLVEPIHPDEGGVKRWTRYASKDLVYFSSADDIAERHELERIRQAKIDGEVFRTRMRSLNKKV